MDAFPMSLETLKSRKEFSKLCDTYEASLCSNKKRSVTLNKATGEIIQDFYYCRLSKPIIDEIDKILIKNYGLNEEELDFIINYDIKYRMGDELNEG